MSINRRMDKEMWYIYTMEYYTDIKRNKSGSFVEMWNGPRVGHTEWSKSEREKQILYINAYIWNLEGWYWWTYLQGSSGDTDTENRFTDTVGKETVGRIGRVALKHFTTRKMNSQGEFAVWLRELKPRAVWQPRGVGLGGRWEGGSRKRMCVYLWLIHVDAWQNPAPL